MLLPALLYAVFAIGLGDASVRAMMADAAFTMTLPSGAAWMIGKGRLLTAFAAVMLFVEVMKAARPTTPSLVENCIGAFVLCQRAHRVSACARSARWNSS
ncbi:MAG: hypothetical protein AB7M12_00745 [Hyphomonadaceae bacterium]